MELETRHPARDEDPTRSGLLTDEPHDELQLPPVDGGKDAWLFLAAGFVMEALVWGKFLNSFHSGDHVLKARFRFRFRGIAYGIGGNLAYSPMIIFMNEWFVHKRGLAFGTMWAGTGVSGVVLPLVLQWLLNAYGHKTTLRIWAVTLFLLAAPLLYYVKPRLPISRASSVRAFDLSFLWSHTFLIFQMGNIVEALGYFLPTIYLPTIARTLGASSILASLTVILCNLASVFGCIAMGHLVDRYHATTCILVSTIGSTLAVFFLWGFSVSLAPLYMFCVVYGLFAGSFTSTWPAIMNEVVKKSQLADPSIVFGFLATGRGIGNIVSGPLSDALIKGSWSYDPSAFAYGTTYGTLIIFTGITALFGGLSVVGRPFKLI
ncbi:unnamed protein product [Aspergillus oryzae var. brunneus]|uniref:Unnamed protein product n=1 Tax=Aspergillus oryzae var. brunneus TaxID=332754 RepID=A0ABQ6LB10_ASPOZ|nr:unnamed protein product [Aspergillus oryzae var. brunneus]